MEQELDIEHRLTAVEGRSRSNSHRLDKLTADVETLKAAPGKRWNSIVEKVIFTVVAAVIGFVLAKIGL